jgi:hypothetical protein
MFAVAMLLSWIFGLTLYPDDPPVEIVEQDIIRIEDPDEAEDVGVSVDMPVEPEVSIPPSEEVGLLEA